MRRLFRRRDRFDWDPWHYVLEELGKRVSGGTWTVPPL